MESSSTTLNRGSGSLEGGKAFRLIRVGVRTRANNASKGGYSRGGYLGREKLVRAIRNNGTQGCRWRMETHGGCNFVNRGIASDYSVRRWFNPVNLSASCCPPYPVSANGRIPLLGIESMRVIRTYFFSYNGHGIERIIDFLYLFSSCFNFCNFAMTRLPRRRHDRIN